MSDDDFSALMLTKWDRILQESCLPFPHARLIARHLTWQNAADVAEAIKTGFGEKTELANFVKKLNYF